MHVVMLRKHDTTLCKLLHFSVCNGYHIWCGCFHNARLLVERNARLCLWLTDMYVWRDRFVFVNVDGRDWALDNVGQWLRCLRPLLLMYVHFFDSTFVLDSDWAIDSECRSGAGVTCHRSMSSKLSDLTLGYRDASIHIQMGYCAIGNGYAAVCHHLLNGTLGNINIARSLQLLYVGRDKRFCSGER